MGKISRDNTLKKQITMCFNMTLKRIFTIAGLLLLAYVSTDAQDLKYEVNTGLVQIVGEVDQTLQNQLFQLAEEAFNKYVDYANFWDEEKDEFSNFKFSEISSLIDGSAKIFNDIVAQPTNIDMIEYTLNIFDNFQNMKLDFDVTEPYLTEVRWEETTGSYVATIEFNKTMYNGLVGVTPMSLRDSREFPKLAMEIEMPGYDVTDYRIINIKGEVGKAIKAKKAKSDLYYLSLEGMYGLGALSTSAKTDVAASFGELDTKMTMIGANIMYRKALNEDEKMFLLIGLEGKQLKFDTDISSYGANATALDNISASTIERFSDIQNFLIDEFTSTEMVNVPGIAIVDNISYSNSETSAENLKLFTISAPVGIGLKISGEPYGDMFFIDFMAVPGYSISSSGLTSANFSVSGIQIPDDPNFPTIAEIMDNNPLILDLPEYQLDDVSFSREKTTRTTSAFTLGLRLAPTYYKLIGFRYAISIGGFLEYSILPPIASNPVETEFLSPIIDEDVQEVNSLLEKYFSVKAFNFGARLGLAYKFGG